MKASPNLIIIVCLIWTVCFCFKQKDTNRRDLTFLTSSNSVAQNCMISGNNLKFCHSISNYDSGYCWNDTDTEAVWTIDSLSNYIWSSSDSNGQVNFPGNTNYILTPRNSTACGTDQIINITETNASYGIALGDQSNNPVWWYRLENPNNAYNLVKVQYNITNNVTGQFFVEVIRTDQNLNVEYYDTVSAQGDTTTVSTADDKVIYVQVVATAVSSSEYVSLLILSDTENTSSEEEELSGGAIAGIVVGAIACGVIIAIVTVIIWCKWCCKKRNRFVQSTSENKTVIVVNQPPATPAKEQFPSSQTEDSVKPKSKNAGTFYTPEPPKPSPEEKTKDLNTPQRERYQPQPIPVQPMAMPVQPQPQYIQGAYAPIAPVFQPVPQYGMEYMQQPAMYPTNQPMYMNNSAYNV